MKTDKSGKKNKRFTIVLVGIFMVFIYSMSIIIYKDRTFEKEIKYSYANAVSFSVESFENYMQDSTEESYWLGVAYVKSLLYLAELMDREHTIYNQIDNIELLNGLLVSEKVKGNKECINEIINILKQIGDDLGDPRPYKGIRRIYNQYIAAE